MKRVTIILAAVVLCTLIALSGCSKKGNDYAVRVNDHNIPMKTYEEKLNAVSSYLQKQGLDLSSEQGKQALESVKEDVLDGLVSTEIIRQEIQNQGWDINDPEVNEVIEELKAQVPNQNYTQWLQDQAMTEEEVRYYFAFTHFVSKDVTVSDEEIRQYFDTYYANYGGQEEQVKARHILLKTEEEANIVIEELKSGIDFAELAREKSIEEIAVSTGGDLGYFPRGRMVAEFEKAAFNQEVGTVSVKPVQTQLGFHVILVEDYKPGVKPSFETAKDRVEVDALDYAKHQKVQAYYSTLRQDAKVEYAEEIKPAIS